MSYLTIARSVLFAICLTFVHQIQAEDDSQPNLLKEFVSTVESDPAKAIVLGKELLPMLESDLDNSYQLHIGLSRAHLLLGETKGAIVQAQLAKKSAILLEDKAKQAQAFNNLGNGYYYQASYNKSLESHKQAMALREALNLEQNVADSKNNIALVYMQMGQPEKALVLYQEAYNQYLALNRKYDQADVLSNIGNVLFHLGQLHQAKQYYQDALDIFKEENANNGVAGTLGNLGIVFKELGQPQKAIELYQKALELNRELNASYYIAANLNNLASLYNALDRYHLAEKYADEAIKLCREKELNSILSNSLHSYAEAIAGLGKLNESLTYALESAAVASSAKDQIQRINSLKFISSVYERLAEYKKSLAYYQQFKTESDELLKKQNAKKLTDSKQALDLVVRDNKIALLEQEKHLLALEEQKSLQSFYLKLTLFGLFIILLISHFYLKKKKQLDKKLQKLSKDRDQLLIGQNVLFDQVNQRIKVAISHIDEQGSNLEGAISPTDTLRELMTTLARFKDFTNYGQKDLFLDKKPLKLSLVVDDCIELSKTSIKQKPVTIKNQIQQTSLSVLADSEMIHKAIYYLLQRAISLTEKGEVAITAENVGKYTKISIRDTALGVDEFSLRSILSKRDLIQVSDTLEDDSLLIAKILVESHGGRITATSNPYHGSIVTFTLPS